MDSGQCNGPVSYTHLDVYKRQHSLSILSYGLYCLPPLQPVSYTPLYPIIQGGMVWCSGWKLASAVSNNGGLGLLGAGSMHPEILVEHIRQMQKATSNPWGVNVPLLYPEIDRLIQILI